MVNLTEMKDKRFEQDIVTINKMFDKILFTSRQYQEFIKDILFIQS